jgi:predicted metalloprotease with PDZ domain
MRSTSSFFKLSGVLLIAVLLVFGGFNRVNVLAGAPAQATAEASATATATESSASVATAASTSAATMTYPPCSPDATEVAMTAEASTPVATEAAAATGSAASTAEPTMAATANPNPGFLGVRAEQLANCGVIVRDVLDGSPASQAGVQIDDVIVALNDVATPSILGLRHEVEMRQAGDTIKLTIQRKGQQVDVSVVLGVRPTDTPAVVTQESSSATTEATTAATP